MVAPDKNSTLPAILADRSAEEDFSEEASLDQSALVPELVAPERTTGQSSTSGRAGSARSQELWVRLEAFLAMRAPKTYETYLGVLREWSRFLGAELGTPSAADRLTSATDLHAMAYLKWLAQRPGHRPRGRTSRANTAALQTHTAARKKKTGLEFEQSNATIHKKVAALRRIYRMLLSANFLSENPFDTDRVKPPPRDSGRKRPTEMVPFDRVLALIQQAEGPTPKQAQDRAILSCLFGGGLRRSEILALRVGDVRRTAKGTRFLYLRATKAGKDAEQALPPWAAAAIEKHLENRIAQEAQEGDPLFTSFRGRGGITPSGRGISASGVHKLFKLYCRAAGLGDRYSPHSARATAITRLLDAGIPHREVQEFSRHSSIQMVEVYDKRRIGIEQNPAKKLSYDS